MASRLQISALTAVVMSVPSAGGIAYNETRAVEYGKFSGAAYCYSDRIESWDCGYKCDGHVSDVEICHGKDTKAYVGRWSSDENQCLLVFEGTNSPSSLWTDLQFAKEGTQWEDCDNCYIHTGFLEEWYSFKDCVHSSLAKIGCGAQLQPLYITGHSLGAALSGLAMMSLSNSGWTIAEGYNYGMPRTGDEAWANAFNARFSDRFFRVTHHRDPIVQVPPSTLIVDWHFEHVEPEIFYDGKVPDGQRECTDLSDEKCSIQYSNLLVDQFHLDDHLSYMDVQTCPLGCNIFEASTDVVV